MKRLLIIEDDPAPAQFYSEEFQDEGYHTLAVTRGTLAMEMIERHHPDVIILDIRMGECDGLDLLQGIRNGHCNTPVIIHSAYASYKHDLRSVAADYFVVKSAGLDELKQKIECSLEGALADQIGPKATPDHKEKGGPLGIQL